jgi:hypothetical protein
LVLKTKGNKKVIQDNSKALKAIPLSLNKKRQV